MKNKLLLSSITIITLAVSACASATQVPPASTVTPLVPVTGLSTDTATIAMPTGPAAIDVGQNAALGSFLVDSNGMTLYAYANDTANTSTCTAVCSTNWPPLLTLGAPTAGTGVTASLLGTTTRADGTVQVTYNSLPLYYFSGDKAPGDTNGEGVKNLWAVVSPAGMSVAPTPTP